MSQKDLLAEVVRMGNEAKEKNETLNVKVLRRIYLALKETPDLRIKVENKPIQKAENLEKPKSLQKFAPKKRMGVVLN
jgi:hypothetical protein